MVRLVLVHIGICTCVRLFCTPQTLIPLLWGHVKHSMGLHSVSPLIFFQGVVRESTHVTAVHCLVFTGMFCLADFMVIASCLTAQIIQPCEEKGKSHRKNGLCMEQAGGGGHCHSCCFGPGSQNISHLETTSTLTVEVLYLCCASVWPAVLQYWACFLPFYFICSGVGYGLWKGDTENRGLSWCHRCKWESLPVANLKLLEQISCC